MVLVGFTGRRRDEDAAVDDEEVLHVVGATPLVHDRRPRIGAHPRRAHEMPAGEGEGRLHDGVDRARGREHLLAARDRVVEHRAASSR